jgi:uncharacterized protein (TIRG00374 family)
MADFKKITKRLKDFYSKHRKKISTALRIIISAGLITYLVVFKSGFKDFANFTNILKDINVPLILAAASIHIFGTWISAVRWQILLRTQGIRISQGYLMSSFLVGSFFNNLLPTSIGGDIFRSIDIANKAKISIGKSASVLVVDRFSGVISAAVYAIIALFLGFSTVGTTSYVIPVVIFFVLCIILLFIILNPSILRLNKLVGKIKFLSKIREKLKEVYHTFLSFKKFKFALFEALLCSFALQMGVIANYYLASRALGIELSFASFIFIVPIVATIAMLPISIGGIGLRENSLVILMVALGASNDRAAVCSLLLFAMLIVLGIIGGIVYVVRPFILKQKNIAINIPGDGETVADNNGQAESSNGPENKDK